MNSEDVPVKLNLLDAEVREAIHAEGASDKVLFNEDHANKCV
ncbi:hypothetical protein [Mycolicibacter heraklionensis]|nr:hypothetical protein [Mycolicibacter heraklionensis]